MIRIGGFVGSEKVLGCGGIGLERKGEANRQHRSLQL